jgi:hypothetical protein
LDIQSHRNYTTNNSVLIEKGPSNGSKSRDQSLVTAYQQIDPKTNTSLKIPTNMINPNEFYQKTVAKNKKGGSPPKNLHNQAKPAYKQNINSARVESRKTPEDVE